MQSIIGPLGFCVCKPGISGNVREAGNFSERWSGILITSRLGVEQPHYHRGVTCTFYVINQGHYYKGYHERGRRPLLVYFQNK